MEMLALIAMVFITECYIAKMIYKLSIKYTYNDESRKKQLRSGINGLQFVAIMIIIVAIVIATLEGGYIN